jgi:hypothetical protein
MDDASLTFGYDALPAMNLRTASAKSGKYCFADTDDADRIRVGNAQRRGGGEKVRSVPDAGAS